MGRIYVSTGEKALLLEGARWAQEGRPLYSIPGEYEYLETVRSSPVIALPAGSWKNTCDNSLLWTQRQCGMSHEGSTAASCHLRPSP